MGSRSNDSGRALEFSIVSNLMGFFKDEGINFSLTDRAIKDNKRDFSKLAELDENIRKDFLIAGRKFVGWANNDGWFKGIEKLTLDRLPDSEGVKSNVADIVLKLEIGEIIKEKNISIKHNHDALKHPRLPRLPEQCGINEDLIKTNWRKEHDNLWEQFIKKSKGLVENATEFKELKEKDKDFIELNLYKPLISSVEKFLREIQDDPSKVSTFFNFLTSELDFYTLKNEKEKIIIKKFVGIKSPTSLKIEYPYENRLTTMKITFGNGWIMTLRLHTASSRLYRKNGKINSSTKFDVHCINLDEVIEMKSVDKY